MNTLAHSGVFWVSLIAGLVLIYFLPAMIGIIRKVESLGLLIFLNVLSDRRRMVCCDGDGGHAAAARAAADLYPLPVPSPVSAGSEGLLVTAARMARL
jgi:hypothetical protein